MSRHLILVSRHYPSLYEYMSQHFAGEPDVEVILDRRRAERRRRQAPVGDDRRASDRRARRDVEIELRQQSHAFVTV